MNVKKVLSIWSVIFGLFLLSSPLLAADLDASRDPDMVEGETEQESHQKFWDWFFQQRAFPLKKIPHGSRSNAWNQAKSLPSFSNRNLSGPKGMVAAPLISTQWSAIGPFNLTNPNGVGYESTLPLTDNGGTRYFAADPSNLNSHWLAAGFNGGIWETKDGGSTWAPRTDAIPSLSAGDIAFAPNNPSIVYAATEIDGSGGILKSTDGGTTWQLLPNSSLVLTDAQNLNTNNEYKHLYVDPNNANTVMVAVSNFYEFNNLGIFKSTDGGNSWTQPFTFGSVRGYVVNPSNFNQQYAAVDQDPYGPQFTDVGVYRTTDAGTTWSKIAGPWDVPTVQNFRMAIAPSNPNVLYIHAENIGWTAQIGFFMASNAWAATPTWSTLTDPPAFPEDMRVDPSNSSVVYAGYGGQYNVSPVDSLSRFNGSGWTSVSTGSGLSIHVDVRGLAFAGNQLMVCGDGGLYGTSNAGTNWTSYNNGLDLVEFYRGAVKPGNSAVMGGCQDVGTPLRSGSSTTWSFITGGDGMGCFFGNVNPANLATSSQGLVINRSVNGGGFTSANGDLPGTNTPFFGYFQNSPVNDDVVIAGSNGFLYKTTNFFSGATPHWAAQPSSQMLVGGNVSTPICYAFAPSDATGNTYAFGTDQGQIWLTTDGGNSWHQGINTTLPNRQVTGIAFDPTNANILYATLSGFNANTAAPGHVFKTTNALVASPSWTNISDPVDIPHNSIAVDPNAPSNIYVGTDIGLFASTDSGSTWAQMGTSNGLPNAIFMDLRFDKSSGTLTAFTYGRGAFQLQTTAANTATPTATTNLTVSATPTRTSTPTFTPTFSGSGINCAGLPVWTSVGQPLYQAGTSVVYAPNNSAYKALVTTYGLDVYSPANAPTVWQLLGVCGSNVTSTPTGTFTATATRTLSPTFTVLTNTLTPTRTVTRTATSTATATGATGTATPSFSSTRTATRTFTSTQSPTRTATATPTPSPTGVVNTATFTRTSTSTATRTNSFTATRTSTPTSTPTPTATSSGGLNCTGLPVWTSTGMPLYMAGTTVVYAPNHNAYKAIVTTYGLDVYSPANAPSVWQLLGVCGTGPSSPPTPLAQLAGAEPISTTTRAEQVLAEALPNISKDGQPILFKVHLDKAARVELVLSTLMGEKVYGTSWEGNSGTNDFLWDLKNLDGASVATGLYIYRVSVEQDGSVITQTGKVAIFR